MKKKERCSKAEYIFFISAKMDTERRGREGGRKKGSKGKELKWKGRKEGEG